MSDADTTGDNIREAAGAGPDPLRGQGGDIPAADAGGPGQPADGTSAEAGKQEGVRGVQEVAMRPVQALGDEKKQESESVSVEGNKLGTASEVGGGNNVYGSGVKNIPEASKEKFLQIHGEGQAGAGKSKGDVCSGPSGQVGEICSAVNDGGIFGGAATNGKELACIVPRIQPAGLDKNDEKKSEIIEADARKLESVGKRPGAAALHKIGKKNFAAVYLQATPEEEAAGMKSGVFNFSDQEAAVLQAYTRTGDYEKTAAEVGIKTESVKRILRRPIPRRYLLALIRKTAIPSEFTVDGCKVELAPVWAGQKKVSEDQKWAMSNMIKLATPKGSGVTVNVQQNSVYGGLSREQVNAKFADARAASSEGV